MTFPCKIYSLLEDAATFGFEDIISWQPGGKSFKVHKLDVFSNTIMRSYFTQSKFKSFQRQLNIYGWKQVQVGPNKGGYQHRFFIRGSPELCSKVTRSCRENKIISDKQDVSLDTLIGSANKGIFDVEPPEHVLPLKLEDSDVNNLFDFFYPKEPVEQGYVNEIFTERKFASGADINLTSFQIGSVDLNDFIAVLEDEVSSASTCRVESDSSLHEDPSDTCFPYKLHLMLENAERENYSHIVSWVRNGTAFKVHDSKAFVEKVLPMFFDQSKYESFRRQLNLYHFTRAARGPERGTISHPCFLQGARSLCEEIKNARFSATKC